MALLFPAPLALIVFRSVTGVSAPPLRYSAVTLRQWGGSKLEVPKAAGSEPANDFETLSGTVW